MRLRQPTVQELENALTTAKSCVSQLETTLGKVRTYRALSNRELLAGWTGPLNWRLQKHESKVVRCCCCGGQIPAMEQHVSWKVPVYPEPAMETAEAADRRRRWAHAYCLHSIGQDILNERPRTIAVPLLGAMRFNPAAVPAPLLNDPSWRLP